MRSVLLTAVMLLSASAAQAQFRGPGGSGGFGGPFGGGGFTSDPARMFEFLSKGRPYFLISETRSLRDPLTQYAKEKGITNDQITKEHFTAFMEQMKNKMPAPGSGGPTPFGKGPTPSAPSTPGAPASPGASPAPSADFMAQMAESDFKRRDRNGDNKLSSDEMSDSLRGNLDQFDKNKDTMVDFEEYKSYFAFRMLNRDSDRSSNNNNSSSGSSSLKINPVAILIMEDYDVKPVVIRAGKLPKELPKWFSEMDSDEDGQIAMVEWRKGGKSLDEFTEWDRNEDGFVTPEEVLRKMNIAASETTPSQGQSLTKMPSSSSGNGGPPRFGGFGGGGFGGGGERPSFGSSGTGNGERPPFGGFGGFGKKKGPGSK